MISGLKKIFSTSVMNSALNQFGKVSIKTFLIFSVIGIFIVLLITLAIWYFKKKVILSDVLSGIVLAIYLSIILQLTLVCRDGGSRIGIDLNLFNGLIGKDNFYHWLMWAYLILNILLFVPYGFVMSLFSIVNEKKAVIQFLSVLLISFIQSMLIECTQLITKRGIFEVQDLACNTLGGVLGWVLFFIIYKIGKAIKEKRREKQSC